LTFIVTSEATCSARFILNSTPDPFVVAIRLPTPLLFSFVVLPQRGTRRKGLAIWAKWFAAAQVAIQPEQSKTAADKLKPQQHRNGD
jgi:hypothetical protein